MLGLGVILSILFIADRSSVQPPISTTSTVPAESDEPVESEADLTKDIPILMYHHLSENEKISSVTIRPESFKNQMKALKAEGYNTISPSQLEAYINEEKPLPENPIMITFDDGYYSNYKYAYPVLKALDMKATIFVIADMCQVRKCYSPPLGWDKVEEMHKSGLISFGSHTFNMHKHSLDSQKKGESLEEYKERLRNDLEKSKNLIEAHTGTESIAISYPRGKYNETVLQVVEELGFELGFSTKEGIAGYDSDPLQLERINVPHKTSGQELIEKIEQQVAE